MIKLGREIYDGEMVHRDAVHVAVAPVFTKGIHKPGDHVGVIDRNGNKIWVSKNAETTCGIIDPFLKDIIYENSQVWMFMYPNSIQNIRHHWDHPNITGVEEDIAWLTDFANMICLEYTEMMEYAMEYVTNNGDDYTYIGDEACEIDFNSESFWPRFERVTGITVPEDIRGKWFGCSC